MTIAHDAYLFNPQPFAVTLADHAERLANDAGQGYRCLRDAAIQSFDHNALTRKLADWYGGWDRASILEELPEQASNNADAIAFSFLLLLYGHLASSAPHMSLGLCNSWEAFAKTLERVGWPKSERELLIKGRSFEYLVEKSGCRDVELGVRLEEIWPILRRLGAASTCGSAKSASYDPCAVGMFCSRANVSAFSLERLATAITRPVRECSTPRANGCQIVERNIFVMLTRLIKRRHAREILN